MSFAPLSTYHGHVGDGSILGSFRHKETDNFFEFSKADKLVPGYPEDFDALVWLLDGTASRYAKVLKTVAYVIVDENDDGLVIEKWAIKNYTSYERNGS